MFVRKKGFRFIALVLVMALCLSLLTTVGLAEEVEGEEDGLGLAVDTSADADRRDAKGYNGMVACADPTVAAIGVEVLKKGGSAADAAVAVAFGLGLGEPAASGLGSSGSMLYYDAETKKVTSFDYNGACPAGLTLEPYQHGAGYYVDPASSGAIAVVPGTVAGMVKANQMFGKLPLSEVLEPVIDAAENGIPVSKYVAGVYSGQYETMLRFPEMTRVFTDGGFPYMEGQIFTNPDFAKTLRLIAEKGHDGFYKGEVAQSIVTSLSKHGGIMTMSDLANYEVKVREPFTTTYRGYNVYAQPPIASGAVILSALNLMEHFPLAKYGHNSVEYLHVMAEAFKLSFADNGANILDPDFADQSGARGMITKAYANTRYSQIKMNSTISSATGNYPFLYAPPDEESHTTQVSIVDQWGNAVSMTNTNANFWGTFVVAEGYGFPIQNYKFSANSSILLPLPGMRTRSPLAPVMILNKDDTFFAALGSPGSERILSTNTIMVSNLIDFGMDVQEAIDAPRLYDRSGDMELERGMEDIDAKLEALKELGHDVVIKNYNDHFGGVHAVTKDPVTGELHGGADPRRGGKAVGY